MKNRCKVVLVGPIYPYIGGIAHFNNCLVDELQKKIGLEVVSWKKRYPDFLFPGKNQVDENTKNLLKKDPRFRLSVYNPISWISTALYIRSQRPEFLIVNWVTPFLSIILWLLAIFQLRKTKTCIICHNVLPHERRAVDKILAKLCLRAYDRHIVHAEKEKEVLLSLVSSKDLILLSHPPYSIFSQYQNVDYYHLKNKLSKPIVLFFGIIREYKGLDLLINAFASFHKRHGGHLIVAGEFWESQAEYISLIKELGLSLYVSLYDDYIDDKHVREFFDVSDFVVLPYRSATQSGVAQIAFDFKKPVITTNVGGLSDVIQEGQNGMIIEPNDIAALSLAMSELYERLETFDQFDNIKHTWAAYAAKIIDST